MNENYTYIIASMPPLNIDDTSMQESVQSLLEWIRGQLGEKDRKAYDTVCEGFVPSCLDEDFYRRAAGCGNAFVRGYFALDLALRNVKAEYINKVLGYPQDKDVIDSPFKDKVTPPSSGLFEGKDMLSREKDMDRWLWDSADSLALHKYFTLDNVLSIVVKLKILQRWISLDREQGQVLLKKFIAQVRDSYTGNSI